MVPQAYPTAINILQAPAQPARRTDGRAGRQTERGTDRQTDSLPSPRAARPGPGPAGALRGAEAPLPSRAAPHRAASAVIRVQKKTQKKPGAHRRIRKS